MITETSPPGHSLEKGTTLDFLTLYETYFTFVHRNVRRLGVSESAIEDVTQEVFLVVYRRLGEFEARSALRTWLFGILVRVVRDHRRSTRRKALHGVLQSGVDDVDTVPDTPARCPHFAATQTDALRVLERVLDSLDDEKREVFILSELEEMTAVEIADALSVNVNTIYSRLRTARREFEAAVAREHASWDQMAKTPPRSEQADERSKGGMHYELA